MAAGAIFILTPTVGWAFPLLWPALLAAAGATGYKLFTSVSDDAPLRGRLTREMSRQRIVTIPLESVVKDVVAEEIGRDQVLRFVKDNTVLVFKRDTRGKFSIEIMGPESMETRELQTAGMEFAKTLVQQFACNKITKEMEARGANVVSEEVNENGDIVLKLRRWG
ncbi:MAG: hypothetical protein NTY46_01660 [Candidatus Sumerlaeota bacterium]|nr:hypothetical protein [Candidatus Sumerlaeota bacterium]